MAETTGSAEGRTKAAATLAPADVAQPRFRESPEWRRRRVQGTILAALAALGAFASLILWVNLLDDYYGGGVSSALWVASITTTVVTGVVATTLYARWATALGEFQDRGDRERSAELRAERDEAAPATEEELTRLVNANRALLDEYQRPVRAQARTSYTYAQIAICVGLVVLVSGIVITLTANEDSARLSVAGLTAVGAAMSAYIARTFLRVYERAQDQLNFYFREPLVTSYLLTAERLAEKLTGELRNQAYAGMVSEIVRGLRSDLDPSALVELRRDGPQ
jgi:hypothetical protein